MNIAVIIGDDIQIGGGFQWALSSMLVLNKHRSETYNFVFFATVEKSLDVLEKNGIKAYYLKISNVAKFFSQVKSYPLVFTTLAQLHLSKPNRFDKIMAEHNIDLIYFVSHMRLALMTERLNYVFTLMDLCHRDFMEFPEVNRNHEFEIREDLMRKALPKAVKVITESELGRVNAIRRYGINEERVVALPMLPSAAAAISLWEYERGYFDVKKKYGIVGDYIYYPAQFWSHKNHIYILEGLKILKEKYNKKLNAIFSGSDKGNLSFALGAAKKLGVEGQVYYIGFVDSRDIPYLYKQALALVMPTYFGPTNIPPLEAFYLECPVLYSDLPGLREQVEGAALLMDLANPESFAENIIKLFTNPNEIKMLVANGKKKVESWTEEDYWLVLQKIFDDYAIKRKCWK